ncbi:flavin-containing monooxygenase [Variovorax saccharolyticus]|uniref:flavin-containing monooxygenase n=1 Tax=Variovorax saccharolyticus TaxID=3053516 RepID=UPI002578A974|nr:NAD(P)/FAD-dependent oxidoreductase [Variovorax sp. J22R187]MDM0018462.1 NAD(P)/FAD-dependent oxidoreductase [Variovorax sp. J22R187]
MSDAPASDPPLDLLIVGAGFSGLYMLHKARAMGLSALILEAAPSVGGTWYANRYPGARVDIQSLEYSFSFCDALQQEWQWTERYAGQPELLRYANHVADRFDLRREIHLNTRMTSARFDDLAQGWRVGSIRADGASQAWQARLVVLASGPLSTPFTPDFPGVQTFAGPVLHTAAWPHVPVDFSGRHVGVVGTGSSAVQVIPRVAQQAASVTVFQRTAAYVVPAHNGPLDPAHEARVKADYPGFRARNRQMRTGFGCELPPDPASALAASPEARAAAFEARWRVGGFGFLGTYGDLMTDLQANALAAEFVRGKIRETVHDPATAALLCPHQPIGCKRLCVADGYYETFNRSNVQLVDLSDRPIEAITPGGLRAGGREHAFDTLVLATGFDAVTGPLMRLDLRGRSGLRIQDKWRDGPLNYLGLTVAGFPNLFNIAGAGSTSAFTSVIVSIEHHVDWIAECIAWMDAQGHATIEATDDAERAWVAHVNAIAARTVFLSCNSWYLGANIPGKARMFMPLAGGFPAYAERCAAVADQGYAGFALG